MPNLRSKIWTETTPAKVEDAQFWENHLYSDSDAKFVNQLKTTGGAGHQILNSEGTAMPKEGKLQFKNATVTDDAENGTTVVTVEGGGGSIIQNDSGVSFGVPKYLKFAAMSVGGASDGTVTVRPDRLTVMGENGRPSIKNGTVMIKNAKAEVSTNMVTFTPYGHKILNSAGTELTSRVTLKFTNATVTDDAENDCTIVSGNGEKGDSGTITVGTVTTGAPGTNVIITNTGTPSDAVLNFTIPRGDAGEGAVTSVNNIQPISGNITLTASDVGALPSTGSAEIPFTYRDGTMILKAFPATNSIGFLYPGGGTEMLITSTGRNWVTFDQLQTCATIISPEFTGIPKAPTATAGTNTTQIATTEFVTTAVTNATSPIESTLEAVENALYYHASDTFATTSNVNAGGMITYGNRNIIITVLVDKLLTKINTVTVTRLTGSMRGVGGYINNASTNDYDWTSNATIAAAKVSDRLVRLTISTSSSFSDATVNTPVTFYGNITLSFS